jgi:hypothetical protein
MSEFEDRLAREMAGAYRRGTQASPEALERLKRALDVAPPPRGRSFVDQFILRLQFAAFPVAATLAVVSLAAAAGMLSRWPGWTHRPAAREATESSASTQSRRVVRFELAAPEARKVALVGDFNGWAPGASPMRREGGVWTLSMPVSSGRHVYAFVVDEGLWVSDPAAPLAPVDGFGFSKSVILVEGPRAPESGNT